MTDSALSKPNTVATQFRQIKPANNTADSYIRFKKTVMVGVKSIYSHGLRSLLTVLGIVIGVAAVIAMLAVSEGASFEAQQQFRDLGASNILLKSVKPPESENSSGQSFGPQAVVYGLTNQDIETIRLTIPGISGVVPSRIIKKTIWRQSNSINADIVGTTVNYPVSRNYKLRLGRFFTTSESIQQKNVTVLSDEVARELFPIENPIGESVKIDNDYYKVVGIMESEGFSNLGQNQAGSSNAAPSRIFIPITAAKSRFGETVVKQSGGSIELETVELHEAIIQIGDSSIDVIQVGEIIGQILARRHKNVDYTVEVPLALLRQAEQSALRDQIVAGAIAGISLLVGGIGIMNIMLASVTERTREIGIRRALGAKKKDIITQFLIEAVILSGVGGLIGVVLGIIIPFVISFFWGMTTIVTMGAPIIAFTISALIGVIFGIYPSMRAADMDPVEALRHE